MFDPAAAYAERLLSWKRSLLKLSTLIAEAPETLPTSEREILIALLRFERLASQALDSAVATASIRAILIGQLAEASDQTPSLN